MAVDLDLHLFHFCRIRGKDWPDFPGLFVTAPPRKAARGRDGEHLIVYLTLSGNAPIRAGDYAQLTSHLAQQFYRLPGSLTAAIRSTAEGLNRFLLDRNLRTTGNGQYIIGRLVIGVLRGRELILAQSGPTHTFHVSKEQTRQIHDQQISGRGLGLSQTTPLYFTQLDINPGDFLVFCAHCPSGWDTFLRSERAVSSIDGLRHKLQALGADDLNAVLCQVQPGEGRVTILDSAQVASAGAGKTVTSTSSKPGMVSGPERPLRHDGLRQPAGTSTAAQKPGSEGSSTATDQPDARTEKMKAGRFVRLPRADRPARSTGNEQSSLVSGQPTASKMRAGSDRADRAASPQRQAFFQRLVQVLQGTRRIGQSASAGLKKLVNRLLPGQSAGSSVRSRSLMLLIAIVVPVLVVTIASMVYMRYGRGAQYEENYNRAVQRAVEVVGQEDPTAIRLAWEQTLFYLDKAEAYQVTQQSQSLRQEAQNALDNMDGIVRLTYHLAIYGGLDRNVQVTRMVASENDLYMLDASSGSVLHAGLMDKGFQQTLFTCGPGLYNGIQVGSLIDIALLPAGNYHAASIVGMDASGVLLYCTVGQTPTAVLLVPPDVGFVGVAGMTLDENGGHLYALDPPRNAVWVYSLDQGDSSTLPDLFFGTEIPEKMQSAIDLAVIGSDLFLLFQDGTMTVCTISQFSDVSPTHCYDITMQDNRPGHQPGATITDAVFTQMTVAFPPDPALYMLEPMNQAVYRFTPSPPDSLFLLGQFRAIVDQGKSWLGTPATAMTISKTGYLFLGIGNQVYLATEIP